MEERETLIRTGLFTCESHDIWTLNLKGSSYEMCAILNLWYDKTKSVVSFEEVFESVDDDLRFKLCWHLKILNDE
jgi:hypothetical protein